MKLVQIVTIVTLLWVLSVVSLAKEMKVTAYCPCDKCCGSYGWGYQTASGHKISGREALVAAPKTFAFGTILRIPGYNGGKNVKVLDRGGAIKGNRLDVYYPTHKEALRWGVKTLDVQVVSIPEKPKSPTVKPKYPPKKPVKPYPPKKKTPIKKPPYKKQTPSKSACLS